MSQNSERGARGAGLAARGLMFSCARFARGLALITDYQKSCGKGDCE